MNFNLAPLVSMRKEWNHKKWVQQDSQINYVSHVMWRIHEPLLWSLRMVIFALALYLILKN